MLGLEEPDKDAALQSPTYRPPQSFTPEDVIDNFNMEASMFTAFLEENYLNFFTDMDEIASATEYMGDSDLLSAGANNVCGIYSPD